ncbi:acyl carrier protein [Streptomyces sp. NPDC093795]|uniref:acyl carrier protein n=1 Tax=Streptomyces sp. NPDC093795 TaxID=3366051 RepID=UPI0037FB3B46
MSPTWNDTSSHTRDVAVSDTRDDAEYRTEPETAATRAWLAGRLAEHLGMSPADLSLDTPLSEYGLDSVYALSVAADLEDRLGVLVDPTVLWDNPTLNALCEAVERSAAPATPPPATPPPAGPAVSAVEAPGARVAVR